MDRAKIVQSLRIVYHGFGPQAFFTDSAFIANGLNASAGESGGVVNVLRFAIDAGIGKLYLPVITGNQTPDYGFVNNAVNYLTYNGMPADHARLAVSIFNDMLGWRIVQPDYTAYGEDNSLESADGHDNAHADQPGGQRHTRREPRPAPERRGNSTKKSGALGRALVTLLIFLISVAVGFGGSYLAFNFSKIYNGIFKSKTTETTSAYTAVDNEIYKVTKNGTPVFSKEDVNSTSVAILDKGDKVTVTAQGNKFSTVRLSNGMTGYIQNEKISLAE